MSMGLLDKVPSPAVVVAREAVQRTHLSRLALRQGDRKLWNARPSSAGMLVDWGPTSMMELLADQQGVTIN